MNFKDLFASLVDWVHRRDFKAWAAELTFFTGVILFALGGHLALALVLPMIAGAGVDFASLDNTRTLIPAGLVLLFMSQICLVFYAILKSNLDARKTYVGVAALLWAAGMLMISFVSLQCDLYGACL